MRKIIVVVEGGLVQDVVSDDPAMQGVEFTVVDYDCVDEITDVKQGDGSIAEAGVWSSIIGASEIEILEKDD